MGRGRGPGGRCRLADENFLYMKNNRVVTAIKIAAGSANSLELSNMLTDAISSSLWALLFILVLIPVSLLMLRGSVILRGTKTAKAG